MPPLNHHLEDKENNLWRNGVPRRRDDSLGSQCARSQSPDPSSGSVLRDCPRRKARFLDDHEPQIVTIRSRDEYSNQEKVECWYTLSDYSAFRRDIYTSVYLLKTDPRKLDDIKYTALGAESSTADACRHRDCLRSAARGAVLAEQAYQRTMGIKDDTRVAQAYVAVAKHALDRAINAAATYNFGTDSEYCPGLSPQDSFNDNWIRSLSSSSGNSCSANKYGVQNLNRAAEPEGFDDSWLCGDSS